jgi:Ca-activated chloride channel family protein
MSFAAPAFLAALALIPLGIVAHRIARRRRRRFAVRLPAAATLAAVLPRVPAWRRHLPATLLAAAVAALAVALARPQKTVAVPVQQASVMLVTDTSRSMQATDVEPSRLDAALAAARRFLEKVPKTVRVGLVAYSQVPHTIQRPTRDREALRTTLDQLSADGGTATGDAVNAAIQALGPRRTRAQQTPAAILLLSDGKTTDGVDPVEAARQAGRLKVPVYTVALGTPDGFLPGGPFGAPVAVPPDPETLQAMSKVSGGQSFTVQDAAELSRVYRRLGSEVGTRPRKREITAMAAGAGLVLLLAGAGTSLRWRGRVA